MVDSVSFSITCLSQVGLESDLTVVRGDENTFVSRYPSPDEIGLLIEVVDSTLPRDQTDKLRIYAESRIER